MAPVATTLDKLIRRIIFVVGRVSSIVLLGLLELVVFAPISFVLWVFRRDPLALGFSPDGRTLWRPHLGGEQRPLYSRQFTYEMPPRQKGHRSPLGRLAFALGFVVLLMAADLGLGTIVNAIHGSNPQSKASLTATYAKIAGVPKSPWWPTVLLETYEMAYVAQYEPLRGWTFPDFTSPYLNVTDGVRRSYEPPPSTTGKPVEVLFLGGSTLQGAFQRDEYTIPSDFARLAAQDHLSVHVVNRGQDGYAIWQEVELLEELLTTGYRPDVVVFYDGVNDLSIQTAVGTTTEPSHLKAKEYAQAIEQYVYNPKTAQPLLNRVYDSYTNRSAVAHAVRDVGSLFSSSPPSSSHKLQPLNGSPVANADSSPVVATERANDAVALYLRAVDLVQKLAAGYGFRAFNFWQPFLYSKQPVAAESNLEGFLGESPAAWYVMADQARKDLRPPVIDLSGALNSVKAPVMIDYEHPNEEGGQAVAQAMFGYVEPALQRLQQAGQR